MLFRGAGTGAHTCRLRLRGGERQIPFPSSRKDKYFRQKKIRAFAFFIQQTSRHTLRHVGPSVIGREICMKECGKCLGAQTVGWPKCLFFYSLNPVYL